MKNINLVSTVIAGLIFVVNANATTVNLGGETVDGAAPNVIAFTLDPGVIAGIDFGFGYAPASPSWSSELEITITAGSGEMLTMGSAAGGFGPYDVELGGVDTSDPFSFAGSSSLLDGLNTAGNWTITLTDTFDDAGVDGMFSFFDPDSWFTFNIEPVGAPEPGILLLLGVGIAGLGYARRRSQKPA